MKVKRGKKRVKGLFLPSYSFPVLEELAAFMIHQISMTQLSKSIPADLCLFVMNTITNSKFPGTVPVIHAGKLAIIPVQPRADVTKFGISIPHPSSRVCQLGSRAAVSRSLDAKRVNRLIKY